MRVYGEGLCKSVMGQLQSAKWAELFLGLHLPFFFFFLAGSKMGGGCELLWDCCCGVVSKFNSRLGLACLLGEVLDFCALVKLHQN